MAIGNWLIEPVIVSISHQKGQAVPAAEIVSVTPYDISSTPEGQGYSNFRLEINVLNFWLLANIDGIGGNTWGWLDQMDIPVEVYYSLNALNIENLSVGNYFTYVKYEIYGTSDYSGEDVLLSSYDHRVDLEVTDANTITVDKSSLTFTHTIGQALPASQAININGPNWSFFVPNGFNITSPTSGVEILPVVSGGKVASGDGAAVLNISVLSTILNTVGTQNYTATVKDANNSTITNVTLTVKVLADTSFEYSPSSFSFSAIKGIQEAVAQVLEITSALAFTLTKPTWLTLSQNSGQNFVEITVKPVDSSTQEPGEYSENIEITRMVNGSPVVTQIPVAYVLTDTIVLPVKQNDVWFTLDDKLIEIHTLYNDSYFQLNVLATLNDFNNQGQKSKELGYKIPLYNKKQSFNIGRVIDRLMYELQSSEHIMDVQYKLADVQLELEEKSLIDDAVIQSALLSGLKFIAGISPKTIVNNCAFLSVTEVSRVTENSFAYLNFLLAPGTYTVNKFRNGVYESFFEISVMELATYSKKIDFSNSLRGDVVRYELKIEDTILSKTFVVFPNEIFSYHLVWLDSYKLKNVIEFTGPYKLKTELEHNFHTYFNDIVELIEKVSTTDSKTFIANTGFILKSEQIMINQLLKGKKAWLVLANGQIVNVVASTKSMTNFDSDQHLYAYDIEFQINKEYDAQDYSF